MGQQADRTQEDAFLALLGLSDVHVCVCKSPSVTPPPEVGVQPEFCITSLRIKVLSRELQVTLSTWEDFLEFLVIQFVNDLKMQIIVCIICRLKNLEA